MKSIRSLVLLAFSFVLNVYAGSCVAGVWVENSSGSPIEIDLCVEYDLSKIPLCEFSKQTLINKDERVLVTLKYMCGYPSDPDIESHRVLYKLKDQ